MSKSIVAGAPRSVAIIMDGNGRWAQSRGLERVEGHVKGVEAVRMAVESAVKFGVEVLTIYAFSTENWGRPDAEVEALMELFARCVASEIPELVQKGVRVRFIGDMSRFSEQMQNSLAEAEAVSRGGNRLVLQVALNYSSRDEITRAVRSIAERVVEGELKCEQINEQLVTEALDSAGFADPDLIIRTSGEQRLSNFMMWQAAYSEFYFTDVLWPDFDEEQFRLALEAYAGRKRRFGKVDVEVAEA